MAHVRGSVRAALQRHDVEEGRDYDRGWLRRLVRSLSASRLEASFPEMDASVIEGLLEQLGCVEDAFAALMQMRCAEGVTPAAELTEATVLLPELLAPVFEQLAPVDAHARLVCRAFRDAADAAGWRVLMPQREVQLGGWDTAGGYAPPLRLARCVCASGGGYVFVGGTSNGTSEEAAGRAIMLRTRVGAGDAQFDAQTGRWRNAEAYGEPMKVVWSGVRVNAATSHPSGVTAVVALPSGDAARAIATGAASAGVTFALHARNVPADGLAAPALIFACDDHQLRALPRVELLGNNDRHTWQAGTAPLLPAEVAALSAANGEDEAAAAGAALAAGSLETDPVRLTFAEGVAVCTRRKLAFVSSRLQNRVVVYDLHSLRPVRALGDSSTLGSPTRVAVHGDELYVADPARGCVAVLSSLDGRLLRTLTVNDAFSREGHRSTTGPLTAPLDVAICEPVDAAESRAATLLLIAEEHRVVVTTLEGALYLIVRWPQQGGEPKCVGVSAASDGRSIYVLFASAALRLYSLVPLAGCMGHATDVAIADLQLT